MPRNREYGALPKRSNVAASIAGWIWPVLAGPFVGSFVGVVIRRLPDGRPLLLGRSACEGCGRMLRPWDMVPLASWLVLRGRCRDCGAPISVFHPAVELAAMLVALSAACVNPFDIPLLWAGCVLGWTLLALGWIDWQLFRLPDPLTLPLVVAGLIATYLLNHPAIVDHAAAAAIGYAALSLLDAGYWRLRGRHGLGAGDAKLFAACGAWAGVAGLGPVLLLGALFGIGIAGIKRLNGERLSRTTRLPFGTCLAAALWAVWLVSVSALGAG